MKDYETEIERRYIPSNGTEGMGFISHFCEQCIHEKWMHKIDKKGNYTGDDETKDQCQIFNNSQLHNRPCYDRDLNLDGWEWFSGEDGVYCRQWQKWDYGNGDNDDDFPPEPEPIDPNQLLLFTFDETLDELLKEKEYAKL